MFLFFKAFIILELQFALKEFLLAQGYSFIKVSLP